MTLLYGCDSVEHGQCQREWICGFGIPHYGGAGHIGGGRGQVGGGGVPQNSPEREVGLLHDSSQSGGNSSEEDRKADEHVRRFEATSYLHGKTRFEEGQEPKHPLEGKDKRMTASTNSRFEKGTVIDQLRKQFA